MSEPSTTELALIESVCRNAPATTLTPRPGPSPSNAGALIGCQISPRFTLSGMSPVYTLFSPNDIAAFLASDDSTWVSGQTIQASGGARL
jgi:NAD(P)-dependent dehydrogenase (short-subunit alcohol dehydrogenase family)